jgi:Arc/MetJ-type ribon-helix-helix transcriptional regulator
MPKQRLSASVDRDLIGAAARAVARGRAESVSAWVNDALRLKQAHEQRLEALRSFVADYEAGHGEITSAEMQVAVRRAQTRAIVQRTAASRRRPGAPRRRGTT